MNIPRHGNKTVISAIWPDEEMPYLTTETYTDEYGVVHPKGTKERVDLITNPLAIINRTIPMVMFEGSVTFILDKMRKHMATMDNIDKQKDFMFDVLGILNPDETVNLINLYNGLTDKQKKRFINDCISINRDGTLMTNNGAYLKWEAFNDEYKLRDCIIKVYEKYPEVFTPYNIFIPKPKWGRDIHVGKDYVGYQYILMLKQSGESGFSVRSAGSISEESLPEKSSSHKQGKSWHSSKPIRFGEWKYFVLTLNFSNCGKFLRV